MTFYDLWKKIKVELYLVGHCNIENNDPRMIFGFKTMRNYTIAFTIYINEISKDLMVILSDRNDEKNH